MSDPRRGWWAVRLAAEREARGWNKHQMARELLRADGLEQGDVVNLARQIRRWEAGEVFPRDWAGAYVTAFGIDHAELFGRKVDTQPSLPPAEARAGGAPAGSLVDITVPTHAKDDDVKRRAALELLAMLGIGATALDSGRCANWSTWR